jgi:hypothetical protein
MTPDSLPALALPHWLTAHVPPTVVWGALQTIVSGSFVAILAVLLALRRFKSERWHERRVEVYGKINRLLHEIEYASGPLAKDEDRMADSFPPLLSEQKSQELLQKSHRAAEQLGETLAEHRYLLSSRAARIIQEYFLALQSDELGDSHCPVSVWHAYAKTAHRDFSELYQVEVGPELGFRWRARQLGRAVATSWHQTKSWVRLTRWSVGRWLEEQMLGFGHQLTQADVRTPPPYKHWKSVEEMKKLGWSKGKIQRELRQQLAGDPPPWHPLPPRT